MTSTAHAWAEADRRRNQLHLWVALALLALLILLWLMGRGPSIAGCCAAPVATAPAVPMMPPPTMSTPAPVPVPAPAMAPVAPVPVVQLFFELDKFVVPGDAAAQLAPIVAYLKANNNAKAIISGYHDPSGNRAANEELAKNRAKAAREVLKAAGVAEERIVLEKPIETTGSGSNEQARRVDVSVLP
jgi:hypothetical protein